MYQYISDGTNTYWVDVLGTVISSNYYTANLLTANIVPAYSGNINVGSVGTPFNNVYTTGVIATSVTATTVATTADITASGNIYATSIIAGNVRSTTAPSTSPPSNPYVGDIWYQTDTDIKYRWTYDGTNYIWVDYDSTVISATNFNGNVLRYDLLPYQLGTINVGAGSNYLNTLYTGTAYTATISALTTVSSDVTLASRLVPATNVIDLGASSTRFSTIYSTTDNTANLVAANANITTGAVTSSAQSSSVSTGAFTVSGGIGVAGSSYFNNMYVGGVYWAANGVPFSNGIASPGGAVNSVQINNNGAFGGATNLYYDQSSGNVVISQTTPSTGYKTGALVVLGGMAVGANLNVAGTILANTVVRAVNTVTNVTGTYNLDCGLYSTWFLTCTGTTTLNPINVPTSNQEFELRLYITYNGGTIGTWPTTTRWPASVTPTLSTTVGRVDIITLLTSDGGITWYGLVGGQLY